MIIRGDRIPNTWRKYWLAVVNSDFCRLVCLESCRTLKLQTSNPTIQMKSELLDCQNWWEGQRTYIFSEYVHAFFDHRYSVEFLWIELNMWYKCIIYHKNMRYMMYYMCLFTRIKKQFFPGEQLCICIDGRVWMCVDIAVPSLFFYDCAWVATGRQNWPIFPEQCHWCVILVGR